MDDVVASSETTVDVHSASRNQGGGVDTSAVDLSSTSNDSDMGGTKPSNRIDDPVDVEMDDANVSRLPVASNVSGPSQAVTSSAIPPDVASHTRQQLSQKTPWTALTSKLNVSLPTASAAVQNQHSAPSRSAKRLKRKVNGTMYTTSIGEVASESDPGNLPHVLLLDGDALHYGLDLELSGLVKNLQRVDELMELQPWFRAFRMGTEHVDGWETEVIDDIRTKLSDHIHPAIIPISELPILRSKLTPTCEKLFLSLDHIVIGL
jgi:hypothetical protein